ncbi:MAG: hypothetical protein BWY45_03138 [Euryarchaeota archaeon ADurb.Bin294]|nr:MAG: hypothetical protein BWY45_03138 [Euryarchaeota archaeon ADurb.Bin294]
MFPVYCNLTVIVPFQPVCDNDRTVNNGIGKPVTNRCRQMICRIMPGTDVHRIGIGQKWFSRYLPDTIHNRPDKHRLYERIIPKLTKMELNCSQVSFGYNIRKACCCAKVPYLDPIVLIRISYPHTCKIDCTGGHASLNIYLQP